MGNDVDVSTDDEGKPYFAVKGALKVAALYKGCDVYLTGHTHKMDVHPFLQQVVDRKRGIVRTIQSYMIITGHFLSWQESYAEGMGLDPSPIGCAFVDIGPNVNGREDCKRISPGFVTA